MKKYLFALLAFVVIVHACRNSNQKEVGKVEALLKMVDTSEEVLRAIDSTDLFSITRLIKKDLKQIRLSGDTLTKEAAFKIEDYIGRTKTLYALNDNYYNYTKEVTLLRKQLHDLKQDLSNNLISQQDFVKYYDTEQKAVINFHDEIKLATNGMAARIKMMMNTRPDFLQLLEDPNSYINKRSH